MSDISAPNFTEKLCGDFRLSESQITIGVDSIPTIIIAADELIALCRGLRDNRAYGYTQLTDITAVDYPECEKRFQLVYHFLSMYHNRRLRLKIWLGDEESIESVREIFPTADWYEREIWDMYGVFFNNHPDLRRILTDYGFQGHPQRKDFPLSGYVEVRYDNENKRVRYDKVNLVQDFRDFDFLSPWQGMNAASASKEDKGDKHD